MIPKIYQKPYVDDLNQREIVKEVFARAIAGDWVGVISPNSAIGKTHTACIAMRRRFKSFTERPDSKNYVFVTAYDLGQTLIHAGFDYYEVMSYYEDLDCLLIDDIGKEAPNTTRAIEEVIYHLFNNDKQLIFTSCMERSRFAKHLDGAVINKITLHGKIFELPTRGVK